MFNKLEIEKIKSEFGKFSSWAIWDFQNERNTTIIENNLELLHNNYVFFGLNISKEVGIWENFHGGKHDRKIKYAFNSIRHIKGAYMTDLIKKVEVNSSNLLNEIKVGKVDILKQVNILRSELNLIKVTPKSKFIIFGNVAREIYDEFFEKYFPENKVYYLQHYSGRGDDKKWVEKVWTRLNITDLEFETELKKYKNHT
jgi:hypothetical protein